MRRLKTEHVDIYVYHSPPDRNEADGVARFLESAKEKGHVRAIGISTAKFEMAEYLQSIGCLDIVQFPENMVDRQPEFRSLMAKHNVGGVLRGAFAGGRLSGKYFHQPPEFGAQDIRGTRLKPQDFGVCTAGKAGGSRADGGAVGIALAAGSADDAYDHSGGQDVWGVPRCGDGDGIAGAKRLGSIAH